MPKGSRVVTVRGVETPPVREISRTKLWAPWRIDYLKGAVGPRPKGCVLCLVLEQPDGEGNLILRRTEHAYMVMNRFPYASGHLMVLPRRHTDDFASLREGESAEIMALMQQGTRALRRSFGCDGFNIGMNLGKVAGAGIAEHLHFHIVPRWNGDTNFMPVLADVNVVNDHLENSYWAIRDALEALDGGR